MAEAARQSGSVRKKTTGKIFPARPCGTLITPRHPHAGFLLLPLAMVAATICKGLLPATHGDEAYFWYADYAHGFIRRGLIGTLLALGLPAAQPAGSAVVTSCCLLLCGAGILLMVRRAAAGQAMTGGALPLMLCAAAPLPGLMAYHLGYPDGFIALLVTAGGLALRRGATLWAGATLIVAALVHELALILLMPMVAFSLCLRPDWTSKARICLVLCCGAGCMLVLEGAHPGEAALRDLAARLVRAGIPPAIASDQVHRSLTQSLAGSLRVMHAMWSRNGPNCALGAAYAAWPGVLILALGWPALRQLPGHQAWRWACRALYLAAGAGPLATLALAFDVSRLASYTALTALLALWQLPARPARPLRPALAGLCVLTSTAYLAFPLLDIHPWYTRAINLAPIAAICPPCAGLGRASADFFNRALPAAQRRGLDTDPAYGDAP
jgi:hypothetical protein